MKNYIVTGAAGFIGAGVAKKLVEEGNYVVTIDNLSTGYESNIPKGVDFIRGDCGDEKIIKQLPRKDYDAIYHIAGQSSGEISFDNPIYDISTNTISTLLLLDYALKNNCKRFIYAGTMSVYGIQPDSSISEDVKCNPTSFYGVGKLASEHYMDIYQSYGINTTSLRLFNVYGPGQNLENMRQGMVSIFLAQIFNDGFVQMKGSKDRFRDFVYIDDAVKAFINCLKFPESENKVINIATGDRTTVEDLIELLFQLMQKPIDVRISGSTAGDLHGIYADNKNMRDILRITEPVSLKKGLIQMIKWLKQK
jgi:UDP-glucose 4-epimerase